MNVEDRPFRAAKKASTERASETARELDFSENCGPKSISIQPRSVETI